MEGDWSFHMGAQGLDSAIYTACVLPTDPSHEPQENPPRKDEKLPKPFLKGLSVK